MSLSAHFCQSCKDIDLRDNFSPFCKENCLLPSCEFNLFKKAGHPNVLAGSAFLKFMSGEYPKDQVCIKGFSVAKCDDGVAVWNPYYSVAWVHQNFQKIDVCIFDDEADIPVLNQIIMRAYSYTAIFSNAMIIHAAAISYDGKGILFCGVPGAGKSTQSKLWQKVYGADQLNNDQPCIVFKDGEALVHGTPWSGKEPCYKNESYPIKAIVFIEKAPYDKVEKVNALEAYALLHLNNYIVPVIDGVEEKYSEVVERIVKSVPVYRQYCTLSENAPKTLHKELFE